MLPPLPGEAANPPVAMPLMWPVAYFSGVAAALLAGLCDDAAARRSLIASVRD